MFEQDKGLKKIGVTERLCRENVMDLSGQGV